MRRLSRRDRILLTAWAVGVGLLAVIMGVALPMRARWVRLTRDLEDLRETLTRAAEMYREAPELRAEIAELRKTVAALSRPESQTGAAVVRQIDQLTRDLGVKLISVRPGEPQTMERYRKHTTMFEVESDFARVARMLYELEQGPRPLWVEGVEITSERGGGDELRARVTVAVYTLVSSSEKKDEQG